MKKVLIMYYSTSGKSEKMAEYIAEGVRFNEATAVIKKINEIKDVEEIADYDGLILGSPTFSLDIPSNVKKFLTTLKNVSLQGKLTGTFGPYAHDVSYQHDNHAPHRIYKTMQEGYGIKPFSLGALILKENIVETQEGIKACHDYGRIFGAELYK